MDIPQASVTEIVNSAKIAALRHHVNSSLLNMEDDGDDGDDGCSSNSGYDELDVTVGESGKIWSPCGNFVVTFCSMGASDTVSSILQSLRNFSGHEWFQFAICNYSDCIIPICDPSANRVKLATYRLARGSNPDNPPVFPIPTIFVRSVYDSMETIDDAQLVWELDAVYPHAPPHENWNIVKPISNEQLHDVIVCTFCQVYDLNDVYHSSAFAVAAPVIKFGGFQFTAYDLRLLLVLKIDVTSLMATEFRISYSELRDILADYYQEIEEGTPEDMQNMHTTQVDGAPDSVEHGQGCSCQEHIHILESAVRHHLGTLFLLMVRTSPQPGLHEYLLENPVVTMTFE